MHLQSQEILAVTFGQNGVIVQFSNNVMSVPENLERRHDLL
jgi:hypothetical protein